MRPTKPMLVFSLLPLLVRASYMAITRQLQWLLAIRFSTRSQSIRRKMKKMKEHPRCPYCGDKHGPDEFNMGWFIIPPEKDGDNPTIRQVVGEGEIFELIRSGELGPASQVFWNLD